MKQRYTIVAVVFLLLAVGGYLGYRYFASAEGIVNLPLVEGCRLHRESCTAALPSGGSLRLDIEPKQPAPTDPLRVTAVFDRSTPDAVGVRLDGVNMNMGYLENFVYELARDGGDAAAVSFSGSAGVFACSSTVMQWLVMARVEVDGARYEIPFHFETRQK